VINSISVCLVNISGSPNGIVHIPLTDVPGIRYGKDKFVTDRVSIVIYRAILLILSGIFSHNPGR